MRTLRIRGAFALALLLFLLQPAGAYAKDTDCYQNDEANRVFACGSGKGKRIALTFDDGPHPEYTDAILDVLAKYNVKATFFVIGVNAGRYPLPLRRAIAEGHEIGSHTYSHPDLRRLPESELREELQKTAEALDVFGVSPRLFRPPGGCCGEKVIACAKDASLDVILWTVDTCDWRGVTAKAIGSAVKKELRPGGIILMHDYISGVSHTAEALRQILPALLDEGYTFVTVSELLEV